LSFLLAWLLWRQLHDRFLPPSTRGTRPFASLQGYSIAVAASLLTLLLSFVFLPAFGRSVFAVFYLAVMVSAWRGGLGPALLTAVVGAAANILLLISPYYQGVVSLQDGLRIGIFVIVSVSIAVFADRLERSKRALATALRAEREARARARAVTDGVDEALVVVSPGQRVLGVNRRFSELFGVPAERVTELRLADSRNLFDQLFEDGDALYQRILNTSPDSEREFRQLVVQRWPQARELQLFSTPIQDQAGHLGRLFVFRDVTHEREVDRMKTEFVSLVSHELRTPLTSIKGFTEMVLDGDAGDINNEVQEFLGIVHSNAERLVALVNDLLDISRIESGRVQLKLEAVDLNAVVKTVSATMQQKLAEKQQTLSLLIDPAATLVSGDQDKLVQVLTNYLSNAHKYTQQGGEISIEIDSHDGLTRAAVNDNGYGIATDDQQQLFSKFYRVDNSMTREIGGTGLGLSIVKQVIELQGGEVGVDSRLGEGSSFWFTIPQSDTTASSAPAPAPPASVTAPVTAATVAAGGTILVVEDDADIARLISHHLQQAGYQVRIASTAEQALASLHDQQPDLITLDIDLPGMHGDVLAGQLKADPSTTDIPILILSVLQDAPGDLQLGVFALPKPIAQQELLSTVAQMLQHPARGPVLVIDDDADVRRLLQTSLQQQGFSVETAEDGEAGLARVREQPPGLILLDMRLPGIDGYSVLRTLKDDPASADIPVIAMTGSAELKTSARARMLALGASDFVAKPFDLAMLATEIGLFMSPPTHGAE